MGYRSNGEIRIVGPKDVVMGAIAKLVLTYEHKDKLNEALDEYKIIEHPLDSSLVVVGLSYKGWKWCLAYADIQALEAVWRACEDLEETSGAFIRLGEEYDDIEKRYFGDDPYDLADVEISISAMSMEGQDIREGVKHE